MRRDALFKVVAVSALLVIFSLPFAIALFASLQAMTLHTVFDKDDGTSKLLITLATEQQALVTWTQRLLIPLLGALSVVWLGKSVPADGASGSTPIDIFRYTLLLCTIGMVLAVIWDYVVVDNWSNLTNDNGGPTPEKSAMLKYYSDAIQNYLVIIAIILGIELK